MLRKRVHITCIEIVFISRYTERFLDDMWKRVGSKQKKQKKQKKQFGQQRLIHRFY